MAIDVEIVGLDPYGGRRRLSGMVGNRALGPRHERCEEPLQMMLEGLGLFDRRLPTVGRQMTDQMQEITKPTKLGFGLSACSRPAQKLGLLPVSWTGS